MSSRGEPAAAATEAMHAVEQLASWSAWVPIAEALATAPRSAGVYMARQGATGPIVYVGMAGERSGKGIRGRLRVYMSGKALASGLGEAVFDRALADPDWLRDRLAEVEAGKPTRAKQWGKEAIARADLHVRWATTEGRAAALALERRCLEALHGDELWNRQVPPPPTDPVTAAIDAVSNEQWQAISAAIRSLDQLQGPATTWKAAGPTEAVVDGEVSEVLQFAYPDYAEDVWSVISALSDARLFADFDWYRWMADQDPNMFEVPLADPATAMRFLTAVVRGERFSDGTIELALTSGRFMEALHVLVPPPSEAAMVRPSATAERFDSDLLEQIRAVISEGDVISTLSHRKPNVIGRIDESGIQVTTERSLERGKTRLVPAWMFNITWNHLSAHGTVDRTALEQAARDSKVKRSAAVFAILEQLPDVSVVQQHPIVLRLSPTGVQ